PYRSSVRHGRPPFAPSLMRGGRPHNPISMGGPGTFHLENGGTFNLFWLARLPAGRIRRRSIRSALAILPPVSASRDAQSDRGGTPSPAPEASCSRTRPLHRPGNN